MVEKTTSDSIGYLLVQTCKVYRGLAEKLWSEIGLHVGQDMILRQLWQADGLMQSELAERLCIQAATVTKMLQRMEQTKLIERHGHPEDQRVSLVYLTEQGRALLKPYEEAWATMEQYLIEDLSLEERVLLRRLLMHVRDNLSKQL
ncbi:MAG: MarR family transcriptional regulator [Chloroflexi bacterium]|nr:MarR family transcriptional regulator [Chloroflexota bacterium]